MPTYLRSSALDRFVATEMLDRSDVTVLHSFRAGSEGAVVLDIFSPPRKEYQRTGSGYADRDID